MINFGKTRLIVGSVIVLGVFLGVIRAITLRSHSSPLGVPAETRVEGEVFSGELIHANVILTSSSEVNIRSINTSCGCSKVTDSQDRPLTFPIRVAPNESRPICFLIDTTGKAGRDTLYYVINWSMGQQSHESSGKLFYGVKKAWDIRPSLLTFENVDPGQEVHGEFLVFDVLPDPGVEIASVESSAPARLEATYSRLPASDERIVQLTNRGSTRSVIRFTLRPDEALPRIQDWLTIRARQDVPPIRVPIFTSIKPAFFQWFPGALTVSLAECAEPQVRHLRLRSSQPELGNLAVVSCPSNVQATIDRLSAQEWQVSLKLTLPDQESGNFSFLRLQSQSGHSSELMIEFFN